MIPFGPLSGQTHVHLLLFASFTLAAVQNVTVDDAVLTGPVVPQFLPSISDWNIGNNCTGCFVKPDPSLAYNGTWHDATYSPTNRYSQAIEFTFTGSALYIFFIIANNVTGATTFTDVEFVLDNDVTASPYLHTPLATTDYQYNVPVYVNESLVSGEHTMTIQPANSGNNVLILFDYLIYSADTSSPISSSVPATSTSPSSSATSSGTQGTSSGPNIGAIVGGTVGGVAAVVLVTASLLCYRRYKRSNGGRPQAEERAVVEPFISSREVAQTSPSLVGATSSTYLMGSPFAKPASRTGPSIVTLQPSIPPTSTTASSSSGAPSSNDPGLHEQVELLRGEVARLRNLHNMDWNTVELQSEAPPEYS